ncbi:MAG: LytR C-terminal domain-containing protein [Pseudomonadales bacterium]|nr:LytR C-terminal domain-containing protein [Pseudomonadales bacterium]
MPRKLKTTKTRKTSKKKNQSTFFKSLIFILQTIFVLTIILILIVHFFVLPSVLIHDGETKNILIVSDSLDDNNNHILIAHLSSDYEKNLVVVIDGEQMINVGRGYGDYKLSAVFPLLRIDKKNNQFVKAVFSEILNISIDEVVKMNGDYGKDLTNKKLKDILVKNIIAQLSSSLKNATNLIKMYLLTNTMEIISVDSIFGLERIYYKLSTLGDVSYQKCSVSVVNTTSQKGLAQKISRIIENTGAQVMKVDGDDSLIEKTKIFYPEDKIECKKLIDRILGIFPDIVELKPNSDLINYNQYRSEIIILVGGDY